MMIDQRDLLKILESLLHLHAENETVEFKEAKENIDSRKLGKYFSAISNEANLLGLDCGWLIFGVGDNPRRVVGTSFRSSTAKLHQLKGEIANKTTNGISFIEIHEVAHPDGRIIMFQIPPAPRGIPVAYEGHYYARNGEELAALSTEKFERIRSQSPAEDWSAVVISKASIDDLDPQAISQARLNYKNKFPDKSLEVDEWDNITFLNKSKITLKGKITRTALILLGRDESTHFLNPADVKIRWILKDSNGIERDYEIFGAPFLLSVNKVFAKIRNLKYRYLKEGTLFPDEVEQYDPFSIREAINNCIAHQDYSMGGRINVVEFENKLVFSNLGDFIPGSVQRVIEDDSPAEVYRNPFLAEAMFNLKMVDTVGGGIKKIFLNQRSRFFPLPDYDLQNKRVVLTLSGTVLDLNYARLLASNPGLSLEEVILLDKVSKKLPISPSDAKSLNKKGLIEGRRPNYIISARISAQTNGKAEYSKNKALDKEYYLTLVLTSIKHHGFMTREDIDKLLWTKLPDWMNEKQKKIKINNLLGELRRANKIINNGSDRNSRWELLG